MGMGECGCWVSVGAGVGAIECSIARTYSVSTKGLTHQYLALPRFTCHIVQCKTTNVHLHVLENWRVWV